MPCHTGLPNKGTASDVAGIVSATMFRNTVRERRIVTPGRRNIKLKGHAQRVKWLCEWRRGEATFRHQDPMLLINQVLYICFLLCACLHLLH